MVPFPGSFAVVALTANFFEHALATSFGSSPKCSKPTTWVITCLPRLSSVTTTLFTVPFLKVELLDQVKIVRSW